MSLFYFPEGYEAPEKCTCGPNIAPFDIVPDSIWGVSIKRACCVHDFMYQNGFCQADKDFADRMFLENMLVLIEEANPNRFTRWLRRRTAWTYYEAVQRFGGLVFWNKNRVAFKKVAA